MVALCTRIGARARDAARDGAATFAVPEAADAAAWVAARARDATLRGEAERWMASGAAYEPLIRMCVRAVLDLDRASPAFEPRYRNQVEAELEAMLALWPDVLVLPTASPLSRRDTILLRAFPVHPLGLADGTPWTDGGPSSPSEFFFHDLDHARFKIREDLAAAGIAIPDAYEAGSTIDPSTGRHRVILPFARGQIGSMLWERAAGCATFARRLLSCLDGLDGPCSAAAELLLFEIVHEKSFPLDAVVLARELENDAHAAKVRAKAAAAFFPERVDAAIVAALPRARRAVRAAVQAPTTD